MKIPSHFILSVFIFISCSISSAENLLQTRLLTPTEAIELVMSEPLVYVGKYIPYDSSSQKIFACVFRNSKATLIYRYCTKKESQALGIIIHPKQNSRGYFRVYAEGNGEPVSSLRRNDYVKYFWNFSSSANLEGYSHDFSAEQYSKYYRSMMSAAKFGCFMSELNGYEHVVVRCAESFESQKESWQTRSSPFWDQPPADWYKLQNQLRSLVEGQP